ncbi:hypothetical protein BHF71_04740 [Vulcanibacillus modesticaldus]|uniref:Uncharacterized protein n=1 Tax=Vulcanibacillus modesticaldus TaxID=337097 RepID=A0A1D2YRP7_9BACI|nr:YqhR family membrane protein [Vulcanibacillus modesticaldus]OEF95503.1 hypothetical protein BHF71_04740 [Vulcanibacillus modesticaldus]
MVEKEGKNQQKEAKSKIWGFTLSIGLSAGVIWGLLSLLAYYLQFTDIGPSIYAKPFLNPDYVLKWQGHFIGVVFFIVYSVIATFIYTKFLVKFKGPWAGIIYGIILWGIVFFLLNPLLKLTKPVKELGLNTNSVMISLYILTGLFIGYSISVEFNTEDDS